MSSLSRNDEVDDEGVTGGGFLVLLHCSIPFTEAGLAPTGINRLHTRGANATPLAEDARHHGGVHKGICLSLKTALSQAHGRRPREGVIIPPLVRSQAFLFFLGV